MLSTSPWPPIRRKRWGSTVQASAMKTTATPQPTTRACGTSARASSSRPAPNARASAEATLPPMPPLAMLNISAVKGTTSTKPASASVPSRPTIQISAMAMPICSTISPVVGPASRHRLRPMGAVKRGWDTGISEERAQRPVLR